MEKILEIVMRLETKIDEQAKRIIRLNKKVCTLERRLTPTRGRPSKITSQKSEVPSDLIPIVGKTTGAQLLQEDELRLFKNIQNKTFVKLCGYKRTKDKLVSEHNCLGFSYFFRYWFNNPKNHTIYRNASRFYLYVSPKNWANVSQAEFYKKLKEATWKQYLGFLEDKFPHYEDILCDIETNHEIPLKNYVFDSVIAEHSAVLKYAYKVK